MFAQMQTRDDHAQDGRRRWFNSTPTLAFLIVTTVLVLFGPICRNGLLAFDDDRTIQFNPRISDPSLSNVAWYWRHAYMDLYVPATYTAWSALSAISRMLHGGGAPDPAVFHAASVALHAINAMLVFLLLRTLIGKPFAAAVGAMLFAIHPVQVEAVAWASGMKDLLCATFSLIALLQYVAATQDSRSNRSAEPNDCDGTGLYPLSLRERVGVRGKPRTTVIRRGTPTSDCPHPSPLPEGEGAGWLTHYLIGLTALGIAMLCKPTAMVTPVIGLVIDLILLRRSWRTALRFVAPLLVLSIACAFWTKLCQPSEFHHAVSLWQRPLIAADTLAFYLFKLIWPAKLTYDYGRTPKLVIDSGWAFATWIAPAAVAVTLFVFRKRAAVLGAAGLLLVIGVAPVLGLTTFDFQVYSGVADHYLYLALLGPSLAGAWMVSRCRPNTHVALPALCVLGLLTLRTATQTRYWRDDQTFFTHAIEVNPRSWGSYFALATVAHNRAVELKNDRTAANAFLREALDLYHRTLELNPNHLGAEHAYAAILMHFGRWQEASTALADVIARRDRLPLAGRIQFARDDQMLAFCLAQLRRGQNSATASNAGD